MPIYIIIVLYNNTIQNITSLNVFLKYVRNYEFIKLIVVDNSIDKYARINSRTSNRLFRGEMVYLKNQGNVGLSKAYNRAIDYITDDSYYIMLSDDDTEFSEEYIENVIKAVNSGNSDVISGIIDTGNRIISPRKELSVALKDTSKRYISKPGKYHDIYCINTGLVIRNNVYGIIGRYDDRLFLDAVDHLFFDKLSDNKINKVEIVPGKIMQNYSVETDDINSRRKRIKIMSKDWFNWWRIEHKHTILIFLTIIRANGALVIKVIKSKFKKR